MVIVSVILGVGIMYCLGSVQADPAEVSSQKEDKWWVQPRTKQCFNMESFGPGASILGSSIICNMPTKISILKSRFGKGFELFADGWKACDFCDSKIGQFVEMYNGHLIIQRVVSNENIQHEWNIKQSPHADKYFIENIATGKCWTKSDGFEGIQLEACDLESSGQYWSIVGTNPIPVSS